MEESNICCSPISTSSSYSSSTRTPSSSPSAGTEGHHDISEPRIGISLVGKGTLTELTKTSNSRAYIHPGRLSSDFSVGPLSPVTPGYEYELDDISTSPPPLSSSPIAYPEPFPYEDENDETTPCYSSASGSCKYLPGSTAHAEAESMNIPDGKRKKRRLLSDAQENTPFVQFTSQIPSTGLQLEKSTVGSSVPVLTGLAHNVRACTEQRSSSHYTRTHPSSRSRINETLSTTKSLSRLQSTIGDSNEGLFNKCGTLPLEHLGESAEQEHPTKKARIGRLASHRTDLPKIRTQFSAKEPASIRRAQSLVSQTSTDRDDEDVIKVRRNDLLSKCHGYSFGWRLTTRNETAFGRAELTD
ncbi:hypothetical protein DEU56DRAFT_70855 [Suillus clintonianus]|uniref:uncharacterized protein n=1 Tax=Suillus clintonianus TaxID=1904413 RepID=UPI001B865A49|nr:uncharacterized protein DEU56DRAFT_70855 [Suillus clintonianus]KAG2122731.1 hypothetical protein DEU56DRAFT_70855 [Suillus clintonianus]